MIIPFPTTTPQSVTRRRGGRARRRQATRPPRELEELIRNVRDLHVRRPLALAVLNHLVARILEQAPPADDTGAA
jgi:hypothetical protein